MVIWICYTNLKNFIKATERFVDKEAADILTLMNTKLKAANTYLIWVGIYLYFMFFISSIPSEWMCRFVKLWSLKVCQKWQILYQESLTFNNCSTEWWYVKIDNFYDISLWHTNSIRIALAWHTLYQKSTLILRV